jgi:cleavage and polyadenylation specificity factor subunit 3
MLQNGPSRKFFEQWCSDKRNGVVLAGYCVEGTLAKEIMNDSVKEVTSLSGRKLALNCEVKNISFAAHSDFVGTFTFLQQVSDICWGDSQVLPNSTTLPAILNSFQMPQPFQ